MTTAALVLIAIQLESLRRSLLALLAISPLFSAVHSVEDARSAAAAAAQLQPVLVVLDADLLRGEAVKTIEQIKAAAPHTRCIVLVDTIQEQRAMESTRADRVLFKGYPAAELLTIVKHLLTEVS